MATAARDFELDNERTVQRADGGLQGEYDHKEKMTTQGEENMRRQ